MNSLRQQKNLVELPNRTPVLTVGCAGDTWHERKRADIRALRQTTGIRRGGRKGPVRGFPVIENNRLYGRGGADDGYALFGALVALAALERADIPHPRCLILIEGCEESGSFRPAVLFGCIEGRNRKTGPPCLPRCRVRQLRSTLVDYLAKRTIERYPESGST